MKHMRTLKAALLSCLCLTLSTVSFAQDTKKADTKKEATTKTEAKKVETKKVTIKAIELDVPVTWTVKKSSSSMRLATYAVKPVEGETDEAELTVFNFPNQDIKQNIKRWADQFSGPKRKSKTVKGKCPTGDYYLVNASGTFKKPKPGSPPFRRETVDAEGYRMLGVILPVKEKGMYFLKLTGPDKTVAAQMKLFRASFGGKKAGEKSFPADE
ncbi:hypothetical protein OAH18_00360 [bacterium]|nr:hypothetical protein [bacterium]